LGGKGGGGRLFVLSVLAIGDAKRGPFHYPFPGKGGEARLLSKKGREKVRSCSVFLGRGGGRRATIDPISCNY